MAYDNSYFPPAPTAPGGNFLSSWFQNKTTAPTQVSLGQHIAGYGGVNAPQVGGVGTGLGFNLGTGQLLLGGISAIGNLYNAFQANKMAKEQFNFQKGITNTNLANQIASYNTAIEDRARARGAMEGQTQEQVAQYIADNSMRDERKTR